MKDDLRQRFRAFLAEINPEEIEVTWDRQSKIFRDFWSDKILNEKYPALTDAEIDEIVLILDRHATVGRSGHSRSVPSRLLFAGNVVKGLESLVRYTPDEGVLGRPLLRKCRKVKRLDPSTTGRNGVWPRASPLRNG